jgi:non-ribosomal peptide synthase protein (TIGR01720 family)
MEILFNYLGAMQQLESDDSLFQSVELAKNRSDHLSSGDMGPDTPRLALFDISAVVMKGRLEFTFIFNRNMRRCEEMDRWISECKWTLEEIAMRLRHCKTEPTLSDYPLLPINYDGLKILLRESLPRAGITDSEQVEDVYPCSPTTEGILLGQLRDPNTYIFHAIYEVRSVYTGCEVEPQRLIEAWQKVVDRHAALRTVFVDSPYKGGAFDQCVLKSVDSGIIHIECRDQEVIPRLQSIRLRDKNARRKLHLPHQMTICSTSTGRVIIKVEINHAVIDGGSTPILLQDLSLAYEGRLTDDRGPLYSDYIRFIRSQSADADVVFWKTYLTGVQPCHLPHQKSNASKRRQLESLVMAFDQWSELQQYCETSGVTLSNVVQASWALVLRKYTGCDDVCFGYLSAGRDAPVNGIQEAIGVFINLLCCRVQLSPSQLLAEIPGKIQDDFLDCLPHQRCSLAQVQHEVGLHGKQLFNTALSIQNHSRASDEEELSLEFEAQGGHDPSEVSQRLAFYFCFIG